MRIKGIHRITVAVRDAERARATFESLFGVQAGDDREVRAFGARTREMALGDGVLELASPLDGESALMKFIERRGEGFYNLALEVEDLEEAMAELASRGVRVSDAVEAVPGVRSAFIAMSATHGLSVQLVEVAGVVGGVEEVAGDEAPAAEDPGGGEQIDLTPDEWSDSD